VTTYTEIEYGYSAQGSQQSLQEAFSEVTHRLERSTQRNAELRDRIAALEAILSDKEGAHPPTFTAIPHASTDASRIAE
jgi:hypothetical protein